MPVISGKNLAKEIMRVRPDIPIILCTGFSEQITRESVRAIGIRAFIKKPVLRRQLAESIRDALDSGLKT